FALSFQAGIVTLLALINPKLGSFNVTDKGMNVTKRSFDFDSVKYLVLVAALATAALFTVPLWLWLRPEDSQAVIVNVFWSIFNLILLIAACLVAFEQPQLRRSHRMPRKLTAVIHTPHHRWIGKTVNISESGVQILLNTLPNIPDEIRVEIEGDYGHKCLVRGRVVREVAMGEQVRLFVDFIELTRTQHDDLVLVIYSDVNEWYSQRRSQTDHPLESLKFIATSIRRVFREFRPAKQTKVRQQVQTPVELYWDYWKNYSVSATITEIGTHDLRLELDGSQISNLDIMQQTKPMISLLVTQESNHLQDLSFLAKVETIEELVDTGSVDSIAIELSFPESMKQQQRLKIPQLLDRLD
ncbi:MAG: cellulose synthase, partial [Moorea sp. SIO4G2]|nr:cellulose synthase [Moorena sp. SIO4G2]